MKNQEKIKSGDAAAAADAKATTVETTDPGEIKLKAWAEKSDHQNISFWIPPDVSIQDRKDVINKMADGLSRYEKERAAGKIQFSKKIKLKR